MHASLLDGINGATPLYLLALYGLVRFFLPLKQGNKTKGVRWRPLETVGITIAIFFIGQLIGATLAYIYPALRGWSDAQTQQWFDQTVAGQFLLVLFVETITLGLLVAFLKRRRAGPKDIGLIKPRWRDIIYALAGYGVYIVSYIVIISLAKAVIPGINLDQQQQIGFDYARGLQLVPVFVSLVILPPLVEELLARGFLYSGLRNGLPKIWAVLVASSLFSVAHLQVGSGEPLLWVAAIDTFVLSLVLITLKEKTGGLWASIGLHSLKNAIAFFSLFVFHII